MRPRQCLDVGGAPVPAHDPGLRCAPQRGEIFSRWFPGRTSRSPCLGTSRGGPLQGCPSRRSSQPRQRREPYDAVPNIKCFLGMLNLYFEEVDNQVGSVTPMYKWKGEYCYPTHSHWHRDPTYKKHNQLGPINNVGGCGVPFLYSLWRPNLIEYINRPNFKTLIHLDRDFGNHIHKLGYKHLRMTNYSVDHYGGGRKSR